MPQEKQIKGINHFVESGEVLLGYSSTLNASRVFWHEEVNYW